MKTTPCKTVILAIAFTAVLVASGCNEQNLSNAKMHRLIADENRHLKKEIERQKKSHDLEIKEQKDLFAKEIRTQREHFEKQLEPLEKLLEDCLHQRKTLEERTPEDVRRQLDNVLKGVMEENENLRRENEKLQTQISLLEAQVSRLKKDLEEPKKDPPDPT